MPYHFIYSNSNLQGSEGNLLLNSKPHLHQQLHFFPFLELEEAAEPNVILSSCSPQKCLLLYSPWRTVLIYPIKEGLFAWQ